MRDVCGTDTGDCVMYYYERDYIMRLIHGIARMLARMLFGDELGEDGELLTVMDTAGRERLDYLRRMVDSGQINAAEEKLFDLLESTAWEARRKAALIIAFYDCVNERDDDFLAAANFPREEIISGLEDAMKALDMEIPEFLRIE